MDIRAKIGKRIKEIRQSLQLTQEALAYKSEVDKTYLNEVENGKRNISIINLEKIVCTGLQETLKSFFSHVSFEESIQ